VTWTAPQIWSGGNIPTAAILNAQWSANLLHLFDRLGTFGLIYNIDPRSSTGNNAIGSNGMAEYSRVYGEGDITKIRMRVMTASGSVNAAVYRNEGTGAEAVPREIVGNSGSIACPAAGTADISLDRTVTIEFASNWFGLGADNNTVRVNSTGDYEKGIIEGFAYVSSFEYPLPGSPSFETFAGGAQITYLLGVP